jgi:hypothetical protein
MSVLSSTMFFFQLFSCVQYFAQREFLSNPQQKSNAMLFNILSTLAVVIISTVSCATVNQEQSPAPRAPSPASLVTSTAKFGLPLETQGAIGEWNDQDKKRAANADPEPSLLTAQQIYYRKKKAEQEADPAAKKKATEKARIYYRKMMAELEADPAAKKRVIEKRRIYDQERSQKLKAELEVNPAAWKRAKENKRAKNARYRLKRDEALASDPDKKEAKRLWRVEYDRKRRKLKKKTVEAAAEEASVGSRSSSLSESAGPPILKAVDAGANGGVKKSKSTSVAYPNAKQSKKTILVPENSNILKVFCDFLDNSEGEITARDDQNKKRATTIDSELSFLTAQRQKKKIYNRNWRQKKKAEQEADPAATKKAKEKKREYDKVWRMKRDKVLDADPIKTQAFQLRQKGYGRTYQLKRKKVKEAGEVEEDEEEKREEEK